MKTTIAAVSFTLLMIAGWITHAIWWIRLLMNNEMDTFGEAVLAILGTVAFPIGCIHGIILWF